MKTDSFCFDLRFLGLSLLAFGLIFSLAAPLRATGDAGASGGKSGAFDYAPDTKFFRPGPGADGIQAHLDSREATNPEAAAKIRMATEQPMAYWVTQGAPNELKKQVRTVMKKAGKADEIPVLAAYNIPFRDCAQYSAGGATSMQDYKAWIDGLAAGIGHGRAIVILEPDGLAIIPHAKTVDGNLDWCQPAEGNAATAAEERYEMLRYAVATLKANPGTKVYLDGGHADWHAPREIAARLLRAKVQDADGFFLNVSNYVATERQVAYGERVAKCVFWALEGKDKNTKACTNDNAFYEKNVDPLLAQLGEAAAAKVPHFVIDTSRNGNDTWKPAAGKYPDAQTWCNPPGRALGDLPTTNTASEYADAYLWIKVPGESDGQCNRGLNDQGGVDPEWNMVDPPAGQWFPEQIEVLAGVRDS